MLPSPPHNIIWIQTAFLGDIVLTTAGIHLAAQQFPQARHFLITTQIGKLALHRQDYLTDIFVLDKSTRNLWHTFKAVKRALVPLRLHPEKTVMLKPHLSLRSALLAKYLGFPTITFSDSAFAFLATKKIMRDDRQHITTRIASLLAPLGVSASDIAGTKPYLTAGKPSANIPQDLCSFADTLIALAPGSQWGTKMWPIENYRALLAMLFANFPQAGIVLLGNQKEIYLGKILDAQFSPQKNYWNLMGKTSLDDLLYLIPKSKSIVANDNAIAHYASACNVATVMIFGPTVPAFGFTPLADKHAIVETALSLACRPCSSHGPMRCPRKHFKCMRSITSEHVFQQVARFLDDTGR